MFFQIFQRIVLAAPAKVTMSNYGTYWKRIIWSLLVSYLDFRKNSFCLIFSWHYNQIKDWNQQLKGVRIQKMTVPLLKVFWRRTPRFLFYWPTLILNASYTHAFFMVLYSLKCMLGHGFRLCFYLHL